MPIRISNALCRRASSRNVYESLGWMERNRRKECELNKDSANARVRVNTSLKLSKHTLEQEHRQHIVPNSTPKSAT